MRRLTLYGLALVVVLGVVAGGGWAAWNYWAQNHAPLQKAQMLIAKGDLRAAQVELRNAIRLDPRNAQAHLEMAKLQMKLADPVAAEVEFKAARATGADPWEVLPLQGEAMIAEGLNREALDLLPTRGPTADVTARLLLLRSVAQLALNDVPGARETLEQLNQAAPDSVQAKLVAARLAASRGDQAATERLVDQVLQKDPAQIDALLMKEQLATLAGDHALALQMADRAVKSAPYSAMAHMRRANQYLFKDQDAKAQEDVDAVLSVQPRFIEAVYLRALILARAGKFPEATSEMEKLSSVAPRFPQALYYQGLLALRLNRPETAVDFAKRYYALAPGDADGVRLLAQANLAAKRPDAAIGPLERLVASGQTDAGTMDLLGGAYVLLGDRSKAIASFAAAAASAPSDPVVLSHYGLALVQAERSAEAVPVLRKAEQIAKQLDVPTAEALATALIGSGDLAGAEKELAQLKARGVDDDTFNSVSALLKVRQGSPEAARTILADALKKSPDSALLKLELAKVLLPMGQRDDAIGLLRQILVKSPGNVVAVETYVPLLLQARQLPQAQQILEAANAASPGEVGLVVMLADVTALAGDPEKALSRLQAAQSALPEPTPIPVLAAKGRVLTAAGKLPEAEATYRAILARDPKDLLVRADLARLLYADKRQDESAAVLADGLKILPGNFPLMTSMVVMAGQKGGLDNALAQAAALRANPANMPNAAMLKGDALSRAGKAADAAAAYTAEYRAAPSGPLLMRAVAALVSAGQGDTARELMQDWLKTSPGTPDVAQALAQVDIQAKRWSDAAANLQIVLNARPDDPVATNNLAWVYLQSGDKRARATAQRAYLRNPTADAADTLGWILVKEGDVKAGLPLLQRAAAVQPNSLSVQYHLASALQADGQKQAAAKVLEPVMGASDPLGERDAARKLLTEVSGP